MKQSYPPPDANPVFRYPRKLSLLLFVIIIIIIIIIILIIIIIIIIIQSNLSAKL